jgi:exodeoxyribonuclease VII small subunit
MNENKFSYEKSIQRIKEIAETLKNNPLQFEENLQLFSEAMSLIKKCQNYIEQAELKVQAIIDGKVMDYDLDNNQGIQNSISNTHVNDKQVLISSTEDDELPF